MEAFDPISRAVIGAAIDVHRELGPGLLESIYESCLAYELEVRSHRVDRQRTFSINYKGISLPAAYRTDLVVDDALIVEVKSVAEIERVHASQLISYLKLSGYDVGLIINFNVALLKTGVRRLRRIRPQENFRASDLPRFPESS